MKKKKPFTRPEGWEKTIKSSYFDDSKTYDGQKYSDMRKKEKEDSSYKKREGFFESIRNSFKRKK